MGRDGVRMSVNRVIVRGAHLIPVFVYLHGADRGTKHVEMNAERRSVFTG